MSLYDLFWNVTQDHEIADIRKQLETQDGHKLGSELHIKDLALENRELKLKLAILVRLMIAKGVFTSAEYAKLLAEARPMGTDQGQ